MDTVYFALGGVFLLASLLVGFGWFANFKVYERDKLALKAELEALQGKSIAEQRALLAKELAEVRRDLSLAMETGRAELAKQLPAELAAIREEQDGKLLAAQRTAESKLADVERRHFNLHSTYLRNKMKANPSPTMALTDAINLLELAHARSEFDVTGSLSFMLEALGKGGKFTADEVTRLNKTLSTLPTQHSALVEKVRTRIVSSDLM